MSGKPSARKSPAHTLKTLQKIQHPGRGTSKQQQYWENRLDPTDFFATWGVNIYFDVAKRSCTCRKCGLPIKKKTRRLVLQKSIGGGRRTPKGGFYSAERYFFHGSCVKKALGKKALFELTCDYCDKPIDRPRRHTVYAAGKAKEMNYVCDTCQEQYFDACEFCRWNYPKPSLSRIIKGDRIGQRVCESCALGIGAITLKAFNRKKITMDLQEQRLQRILLKAEKTGKLLELD